MEPKFTKGEWKENHIEGVFGPYYSITADISNHNVLVSTVRPIGDGTKEEYNDMFQANANLIAAAPEMYEALDKVNKWLDECDLDAYFPKLDELLKKARGEA